MIAMEPVRDKNAVSKLAAYYLNLGQLRNYMLIMLGLYTALRVSDILLLRWDDVYDFENGSVKSFIYLSEKKTGKSKTIALNMDVIAALKMFAARNAVSGVPLICNYRTKAAISRVQAYRIVRAAGEAIGTVNRVSCHALRKTFGYHALKEGTSPVLIMDIFNHKSLNVTMRYLGFTQDDKNNVYLGLSFFKPLEIAFINKDNINGEYADNYANIFY